MDAAGSVRVATATSPLGALVRRAVVRVAADATVADAVDTMRVFGVSALVVGERDAIVTERDLARGLGAGRSGDDAVALVATAHPLSVPATVTVVDAARIMLNEQVRHLLVERPDGTVGVVSMRDLLAVLLQTADPHLWMTELRIGVESPSELWLG